MPSPLRGVDGQTIGQIDEEEEKHDEDVNRDDYGHFPEVVASFVRVVYCVHGQEGDANQGGEDGESTC